MRVLIATLLLVTTLVIAGNLAASYVALSRIASLLPDAGKSAPARIVVSRPQAAATSVATPVVYGTDPLAVDLEPATDQDEDERAGARAMQAAAAADPEIAALLDDRDPNVRDAMRAFFEDAPASAPAATGAPKQAGRR
jgi:hypothetical protein